MLGTPLKIPDCSASLGGAGASTHRAHSQTPPGKNAPRRPLASPRPDMARCARHTAGPSVWTTIWSSKLMDLSDGCFSCIAANYYYIIIFLYSISSFKSKHTNQKYVCVIIIRDNI